MSEPNRCPRCGAELPAGDLGELCPQCLLAAGLESQDEIQSQGSIIGSEPPTSPHPGRFVPPDPASLAAHFPQLEILEIVGCGGMGAVYSARQTRLDRLVALKIIRPEAADDPAFAERFNREARMLARLSHPHIVAVYDFGDVSVSEGASRETPRRLYFFLMEYVDGANLRQLMRAGELTPHQALAIVPQICEALQFAHDQGIVHRDIKPENILLDKRGRVKIADFGLAKLAAGSTEDFTLTGTHQVMGTPRYMAPEQMEGSRAVDHRADIYSLGVVFYEMLTGEVPAGHFEPPSKKVEVDVRLDEVVLRALAREPERRYQQASEVKTDVEAISLSTAALRDTQSLRPDRGHVVRFLSNSTGWIILFCVIGACLSCLPWWHVTATGAGNVVYLVQPGYQEWVGRFAIGAFLGLGLLLIIDGVKVAPLPTWRPIVVVATATALLFVLGLNALGWRPGTIQVTEVSGDVGPLNDLADLAHEALTSIARFVPGVGFYSALTNAGALLVLGLGQLRSVLQAHRTVGAPVVESSRPNTSDEAAVVAGVKASIPQTSASQRSPAAGSQATTPQPASSGHPHGEVATDDAQIEAARQLVQFPAMGLTVIGILLLVLGTFAGLLTSTWALRQTAPIALFLFLILSIVALTALSTWIIVGGLKMLRLTSYGWAVGASVLAVSPIPAGPLWLLSLPLGVWSLVVLSKPEVKRGFARCSGSRRPREYDAAHSVQNPAWGLIITAIISWVTIPLAFWIPIIQDMPATQRTIFQINFGVVPLIVGTTMAVAGFQMRRLEGWYRLAMVASVLPIVVLIFKLIGITFGTLAINPADIVGAPIGLWALVILTRADVQAAFRSRPEVVSTGESPVIGRSFPWNAFWIGLAALASVLSLIAFAMYWTNSPWPLLGISLPWFVVGAIFGMAGGGDNDMALIAPAAVGHLGATFLASLALVAYAIVLIDSAQPLWMVAVCAAAILSGGTIGYAAASDSESDSTADSSSDVQVVGSHDEAVTDSSGGEVPGGPMILIGTIATITLASSGGDDLLAWLRGKSLSLGWEWRFLVGGPVVVLGGMAMLQRRAYWLAVAGGVACLPLGLGSENVAIRLIPLGLGLYSLYLLTQSEVRESFRHDVRSQADA